jgi:glycosyltransferase involved in cell wall biosynthesis
LGWIHNSHEALFGKGSTYIGPELRRYYEYMLQQLDQTIVLSKDDARKYPFPTRVIYNPLTLEPSKPSSGQSKKFLAVGRFSHLHKGFDLLIDAFHLFAQRNNEWTLDIVGEGPEEPLYRQKIADQLQAATQIDWIRKSEEAKKIARRFDISEVRPQWQEVL